MCYFCENQYMNIDEYIQSNLDRFQHQDDESMILRIETSKKQLEYENNQYNMILNDETNFLFEETKSFSFISIYEPVVSLRIQCPYLVKLPILMTKKRLVLNPTFCKSLKDISFNDYETLPISLIINNCGIKTLEISNIRYLEIDDCDNLEEITKLNNIYGVHIDNCKNISNIIEVNNITELCINRCKKLISNVKLTRNIKNIKKTDNLMKFINVLDGLENKEKSQYRRYYTHNSYKDYDYNEIVTGINRIVQQWKLRKFVKLCESRDFNEYFYHPEHLGGQWHFTSIKRMCDDWNSNGFFQY